MILLISILKLVGLIWLVIIRLNSVFLMQVSSYNVGHLVRRQTSFSDLPLVMPSLLRLVYRLLRHVSEASLASLHLFIDGDLLQAKLWWGQALGTG